MPDIHKLIAAISPDTYCSAEIDNETGKPIRDAVKEIVRAGGADKYMKAADKAKLVKSEVLFDYDEATKNPVALWGLTAPKEEHKLNYDSASEGLEPIYFWLLDYMNERFDKDVEKITDNFVASPGSGHFQEMQNRLTQMQQEISRTMGNVNTVIKSILNLIYDLKDFNLRLDAYKLFHSENRMEKFKGLLSLKQVWLDNVDIRKGRGSINALSSGELDFVTLRDAFMAVENSDLKDRSGREIDLNDRVKRILKQRADEFFRWIDESEKSLKQRSEIEKNYLRSQVNMLKLYARWVKPYLKAAQKLEQNYGSKQAALVTTFNTMLLELSLLAKSQYKPSDDVGQNLLPEIFKKLEISEGVRKYYTVVITEFKFRTIPQKISQRGDWGFGGRADVTFTSYALNDQELQVLKEEMERDDFAGVMSLIEGATEQSLNEIAKDLDDLLGDKKKEEEEKKKKDMASQDVNPFGALFGNFQFKNFFKNSFRFNKKKKDRKDDLSKGIKPDDKYEKVMRSQAIIGARKLCFNIYDTYKKAHSMPSHPDYYDKI